MTAREAHFVARLGAFRRTAWQLRAAWEALENTVPPRPIRHPGPFLVSFDDWCHELDGWVSAVCAERFELPLLDAPRPRFSYLASLADWLLVTTRLRRYSG